MMNHFPERVNVLGVEVSAINPDLAVDLIQEWIDGGRRDYVVLAPAHTIMDCYQDDVLRRIVNRSGMVAPDGMSIVWIMKSRGSRCVSRVYGPDLIQVLCEISEKTAWRHYFYGGKPGVAEKMACVMKEKYPDLHIRGHYSPPYRDKKDPIPDDEIARLNSAGADIVWVGLGSPKQEYWMAQNRNRLHAPVLIGVGAAFDFLTGELKQAPVWIQRSGFEWLYRLVQEPGRLWGRYRKYPLFCWLVLGQMMGLSKY